LDIVPPEVPKLEKKQGFLKKIFSHKSKTVEEQKIVRPTLDNVSVELPDLPELPSLDTSLTTTGVAEPTEIPLPNTLPPIAKISTKNTVGKSKGKGTKQAIERIDESNNFNWTESVSEQDNMISDSNRNNEDVNNLIISSDQHIEDQKKVLDNKLLTLPENLPEMKFDNPEVPDITTNAVPMPPKERKFFNKLGNEHKKIRKDLNSSMKHFTRPGFVRLLKQYDDKIESIIEQKQVEYSKKSIQLTELSKSLSAKQLELNELQKTLKSLQTRLNAKEKNLEESVTKHVEKQLVDRSKKEKAMLRKELQKTISMNKDLKIKLDTIKKDRLLLENTRTKLVDEYRKKLNSLQQTYEHKLGELNKERTDFEDKRKHALELLHKADLIQKEKNDLDKLKNLVEQKKHALNERLHDDLELKQAIDQSETKLSQERENLDNMIFSKYIKWKLSDSKDAETISEMLKDPKVDEINNMIVECRSKALSGNVVEAKRMYNTIKHKFETYSIDDYNRSILFNSIRELYGDIQIAVLKI
jgi:hypothetical protein